MNDRGRSINILNKVKTFFKTVSLVALAVLELMDKCHLSAGIKSIPKHA